MTELYLLFAIFVGGETVQSEIIGVYAQERTCLEELAQVKRAANENYYFSCKGLVYREAKNEN